MRVVNRKFPGLQVAITGVLAIALFLQSFRTEKDSPSLPGAVEAYVSKYLYLARMVHQESDIPLAIIMAVAGLESDWGRSELAMYANNHFGIKAKDWNSDIYCKTTQEYYDSFAALETEACFRRYALIRDSYVDFGTFLRNRRYYQELFDYGSHDYRSWAIGLQEANYGTDPYYASKLLRIIHDYQLDRLE